MVENKKKDKYKKHNIIEKKIIPNNIDTENKILRNILIFIGIFILIIIVGVLVIRTSSNFDYKGVKFDITKEGKLTLYHTSLPVLYEGKIADYNIYLRNDPRELEKKISASGPILSIEDTAVNMTGDFNCEGDEIIALANLKNIYDLMGKKIMKDENASCDPQGRYMYLNIQPGNETNIEMVGPNCYNINIKDCEILEGTERFIVGLLVKINREL